MIKIFFTYILPLVLPTVLYVLWVWSDRRKHKLNPSVEKELPKLRRAYLFWSLATGMIMMIFALIAIALMTGAPPNSGTYQSPRLEDGEVIAPSYKKN